MIDKRQRIIEVLTIAMEKPDIANALIQRVINELSKAQPEQDDGYCQACEGNYCTAKDGCVARDNPPQREWQGLTDDEIIDAANMAPFETMVSAEDYIYIIARAVEDKLKEKNST